tara:strand:+ start:494 stop:664 length:171 start_codon:yes stop_codon:yes gene_type:complete
MIAVTVLPRLRQTGIRCGRRDSPSSASRVGKLRRHPIPKFTAKINVSDGLTEKGEE